MDFKRPTTLATRSSSMLSSSSSSASSFSSASFKRPVKFSRSSTSTSTTSSISSTSTSSSRTEPKKPNFIRRSSSKAVRVTDRASEQMRYSGERLLDWCCVGIERMVV
ncbi:hypothetical protein PVAG01_01207 [Phlyctema vagabunda]|uniref:Uncharacterized protein n=1 Tax=Phlyctema vagabunda TaxID=108571 RepID=A0ABR4PWH3_9HELO